VNRGRLSRTRWVDPLAGFIGPPTSSIRFVEAKWLARSASVMLAVFLCASCTPNSPPMYHSRAKAFLEAKGVAPDVVAKIFDERPLADDEARALSAFDDAATLHLLGANPGTPADLVATLAMHRSEEVRWGAATHPKLPPATMVALRTSGKYSTMNDYLARNPALPTQVIREMYWGKQALPASVAMNPSCPMDIVSDILENQPEHVRVWLAWNRGLDSETLARLDRDPAQGVARMLKANPTYVLWKKRQTDAVAAQ
jgi:hypothetical protein